MRLILKKQGLDRIFYLNLKKLNKWGDLLK
jgi:hypothetical protein